MAAKISKTGYKRTSPDIGAKRLRIPSNQITMDGVDFPVIGIDNLGNEKLMQPGMNYEFPGAYVDEQPAKSGIHIKPENRGKFTAYKKRTGKTTEEALHSSNPHVRQMANFARNAKKWHHGQHGLQLPEEYLQGMQATKWKPNMQPPTMPVPLPTFSQYRERMNYKENPMRFSTQAQADLSMEGDTYKNKPDMSWAKYINPTLLAIDMLLPGDKIKDPVVQPGLSYNEHPYGTGSQAISKYGRHLQQGGVLQSASEAYTAHGDAENLAHILYPYPTARDKKSILYGSPSGKATSDSAEYVAGYTSPKSQGEVYPLGLEINSPFQSGYYDRRMAPPSKSYSVPDYTQPYKDFEKSLKYVGKLPKKQEGGSFPGGVVRPEDVQGNKTPYSPTPASTIPLLSSLTAFGEHMVSGGKNMYRSSRNTQFVPQEYDNSFDPRQRTQWSDLEKYMINRRYLNSKANPTYDSMIEGLPKDVRHKNLRFYQVGGPLAAANAEAKRFAQARGLIIGDNAYVDRVPQYIDSGTGRPYVPLPTKSAAYNVPNDVQLSDIQSYQGKYWYNSPQTGDVVDVDPSVLNLPRFRKAKQQVGIDLANRQSMMSTAKLKDGGKIPSSVKIRGEKMTAKQRKFFQSICDMENGGQLEKVYEHGGTYEMGDDEIRRLVAAGYELKIK